MGKHKGGGVAELVALLPTVLRVRGSNLGAILAFFSGRARLFELMTKEKYQIIQMNHMALRDDSTC
jgi:hypothetical protein